VRSNYIASAVKFYQRFDRPERLAVEGTSLKVFVDKYSQPFGSKLRAELQK
jgi:hypothetical protein